MQPRSGAGELVERIWAHDATLWTGADEARWLGWLDLPVRMREHLPELERFAESVFEQGFEQAVLLGMGGSSLAAEVFRRALGSSFLTVLDTTHPDGVRALADCLDPARTLVLAASKSGTTVEVLAQLDYFWELLGGRSDAFVALTDPGSPLEQLAQERRFRHVFAGEPSVGGRYSALSIFGLLPAALLGADLDALLARAEEMAQACRRQDGPGAVLGLALGEGWLEGRDKVVVPADLTGFCLWLEQLLAESTGKDGKGLIPLVGGVDGSDRQRFELALEDVCDLGAEFFRCELATAVAGALIGVNPFDQPDVQGAKQRTQAALRLPNEPSTGPCGSLEEVVAETPPDGYLALQAFVEPSATNERLLVSLSERLTAQTGLAVTAGFGPRYLHSTGQLHKGGPPVGGFVQIVDDPRELPIPGRAFGFRRLIQAQATGDLEALRERGRPVARLHLQEVEDL